MTEGSEQAAPKKLVLSLVRRFNEMRMRVQGIGGELGAEFKEAAENKHLHVGALKLIAKMARMDELKRNDFIRAYHLYWTYAVEAGLFKSTHAGDLVDDADLDGDESAALGDVAAENVRKIKRGIKKTPEEETGDVDPPGDSDGGAAGSYALQQ